jgi:hypothetical protein
MEVSSIPISGGARESAGATLAIVGGKKNVLLVNLEFLILGAVSFKLPSWTKKKFSVLERMVPGIRVLAEVTNECFKLQ